MAAAPVFSGCGSYFYRLPQPQKTVAAVIPCIFLPSDSSGFSQVFDDTFHLFRREAPDAGAIAQLDQFRFQHAMIIDPPPQLQDGRPAAQVGAVKCRQFADPVGSYREGCLFHNMNRFISLRYEKSMDVSSVCFFFYLCIPFSSANELSAII